MLLNNDQYKSVWDRVYNELQFYPSMRASDIPFVIKQRHTVYKIKIKYIYDRIKNIEMFDNIENMEKLISNAFINCTRQGERIYALDWQHSAFLYDPRNPDEQRSFFVKDDRYFGGGYNAEFPEYFPDGDYYFFISEDFRFGYLTHPWRQEAWVFGDELIEEFESFYESIGWKKLK